MHRLRTLCLSLIFALALAFPAWADIYRYRTPDGRLVVTNTQPPPGAEILASRAEAQPPSAPKGQYEVNMVDWTSRHDSGNDVYVEGYLRNDSDHIVRQVRVEIRAVDRSDSLVAMECGYTHPSTLAPGQEGSFQIMVRKDARINTFQPRWTWQ